MREDNVLGSGKSPSKISSRSSETDRHVQSFQYHWINVWGLERSPEEGASEPSQNGEVFLEEVTFDGSREPWVGVTRRRRLRRIMGTQNPVLLFSLIVLLPFSGPSQAVRKRSAVFQKHKESSKNICICFKWKWPLPEEQHCFVRTPSVFIP